MLNSQSSQLESPDQLRRLDFTENVNESLHPLYSHLSNIANEEGRRKYESGLIEFLDRDAQTKKIVDIFKQQSQNNQKYSKAKISEYKSLNQTGQDLSSELSLFDNRLVLTVRRVFEKLLDYQLRNNIMFDENYSNSIIGRLLTVTTNSNSFNYANLFNHELMNAQVTGEIINLHTEKLFMIPVGQFVGADNLANWHGRGEGNLKDEKDSRQVILDYASRVVLDEDIKNLAVESMSGYLYPNGEVYFVSGNAHRVAAAIRRGDKAIAFRGSLTLKIVTGNIPSIDYNKQS